jgi:hypothetical protein
MQRRDVGPEVSGEEKHYDIDRMKSERDVDGLIGALQSTDALVRQQAALVLGTLGDRKAVDPLIRKLDDPELHVRETAASSLVTIGGPSVEPLIQALERREMPKQPELHRGAYHEGLPQHRLYGGPEGVTEADRESLRHEDLPQHDMFAGPEDIGAKKKLPSGDLAQHDLFGGPEGIPPGEKEALSREDLPQHDMFAGPGDIGPKKKLRHEELTQHDLLGGPEGVKGHEALHREEAAPTPEEPMAPSNLQRIHAALILGEIGDPRAMEPLSRAMKDDDPEVRKAAEAARMMLQEKQGVAYPSPPPM